MSFSDILGQKYAIGILKRALETGNISHAYLFYGPENVGKTITALWFAKALNCQKGELDACDVCLSCKKINSGNHPDVRVIRPVRKVGEGAKEELTTFEGRNILIDQVRDLKREALYKPYEGKWKVYIIDEADKMNRDAQNAALKLFEEPPPFVVIILVTANREPLLPTVLSRCQPVRFNLVPIDLIQEKLKEQPEMSDKERQFLSLLSAGRLGWALRMAENKNLLQVREKLFNLLSELPRARRIEAFRMVNELKGLAKELVKMQKKEEEEESAEITKVRMSSRIIINRICELLDLVALWYRDLAFLWGTKDANSVINRDKTKSLGTARQFYPPESLKDILPQIIRTKRYIQRNANIQLALEVLFLKLISACRQGIRA